MFLKCSSLCSARKIFPPNEADMGSVLVKDFLLPTPIIKINRNSIYLYTNQCLSQYIVTSIKDVRFMLSKWLKALTLGKCVSVCVRYNSVRMWKYSLSFETYMLFKPKYQVYILSLSTGQLAPLKSVCNPYSCIYLNGVSGITRKLSGHAKAGFGTKSPKTKSPRTKSPLDKIPQDKIL